MKYFKCENCGSELTKNQDGTCTCSYCRRTYYDDSLEKAYDRVYQNLRGTVQGIVTEELLKQKIEQIANCRQSLYKECHKQFIDNNEIARWAAGILTLSPDDAQANFYAIASKKRWSELNQFMQKLNAREVSYLVEGFVDYLTNGQFVSECILSLIDLIERAFDVGSVEYEACHKKLALADKRERSGIFDVSLPRDVFVAYSSKDKEQAYALVEYLEKNSFKCFIAMRNLAKGVDAALKYNERLKTAMDSCRIFLLVSLSNSRARDCDAYSIEMKYIRESDCRKANDFALANARYDEYLEKNRNRCKPRIEYLIEEYGTSPYEKMVKQFFSGLTWCRTLESVSDAVFDIIEGGELETFEDVSGKSATAPTNNMDDLYKAFKERERQEEERKRQEELERKRQAELERKRQAEEAERKRKEEEERKRQEERIKREFEIKNGGLEKYKGKGGDVVIPDSVTEICYGAFEDCTSLTSVIIPDSVTAIGYGAFHNCKSLTSIVIGNSVTKIGHNAFKDCTSLTSVIIPDSVTSIGCEAFHNCKSLTSIVIGNSVTSIERDAFKSCGLKSVEIPNSVTFIGEGAFDYCMSLTSVVIGDGVTSIDRFTFHHCTSLTSVVIGDSLTSIGYAAFAWCHSLTSLVIPNSVTKIGHDAFERCGLKNIYISDIVAWCNITGLSNLMECGSSSKSLYLNNELVTELIIPNGVTSIDSYAFSGCTSLTSVVIPNSVTWVGYNAFINCSKLTIYAEAKHKPKDWYSVLLGKDKGSWNPEKRPVVWGATRAEFDKA